MDAPYVVFHGSRLCAWLMRRAYNEMLQGCIDHPDQWEFYTIWMIELHDGMHIGDFCFKGIDENGITEIGYGILPEYCGRGYATEAINAAVEWALRHPNVKSVEAETIEGSTIFDLIQKCVSINPYIEQVQEMDRLAKASGLHIDYYPTNFVVSDDLLWYIDYECNNYIEQWDFEHWGKQYWR